VGAASRGGLTLRPQRVLFVHHTALISGAERSLLGLLGGMAGQAEPVLACPDGPLRAAAGVPSFPIRGTAGSFKLHPLHTPLALAEMGAASAGVARAARRCRAEILHANSVRAALTAAPAARALGLPLVVHVRDVLPEGGAAAAIRRVVLGSADAVIAISHYVASAFDPLGRARRLTVIDNPLDTERFDPERLSVAAARERIGMGGEGPLLGEVGQITPWKAQDDAIRILAIVRREHPGARLLIVGEPKFVAAATRFDNRAFVRTLHGLADELGVADSVSWLGEREDVPEILRALDVALVPSWEEPFGRTVVEAMTMGLPVIATSVGGPGEVITDGHDGLLLAPRRPEAWAEATTALLTAPGRAEAMGAAARESVLARFGVDRHVAAVLEVYRGLL
jgi:glycosyltransferase involved in cell wall biosynthesis